MTLLFTFKDRFFSAADNWQEGLPAISEESRIQPIKEAFARERLLLIEHWFYRGGSAPNRIVFDDFEMFEDYLKERCSAGDSIHVFDITEALKEGQQLTHGKCPNGRGEVPKGGAY